MALPDELPSPAGDPSFAGISETASDKMFITAAQMAPMLSAEQEADHFAVILRERSLTQQGVQPDASMARRASRARDQLARSHMRLVIAVARQHGGYGMIEKDLIQEGAVGLLKAIERFEPGNGARLSTYAMYWIRAEIQEHVIRNNRMVKTATTKSQRKLFFNLRSMKRSMRLSSQVAADEVKLQAGVTSREVSLIAAELNVELHEVREMDVRLSGIDYSLEQALIEGHHYGEDRKSGAAFGVIAPILSDFTHSPEVLLERRREYLQATQGIADALDTLDARSKHIIESRWLADEDEQMTLVDLAKHYGVSAERIRQIEAGALKKLRTELGASHIVN